MPAITPKVQLAEKNIERILPTMPTYVQEYVQAKKRKRYSPLTLSEYLYEYNRFFTWLLEEGIVTENSIKTIPYTALAELKKADVECFIDKLSSEILVENKYTSKKRSTVAVARSVQALKSLFKYLTTETEIEETGEAYFYRNVMAKIEPPVEKESRSYRSKRIEKKTYRKNEVDELLVFVENEYAANLTTKQLPFFVKNKERDLAILSLLFGSGIRGSELLSLQKEDVFFKDEFIEIIRKGDKKDAVPVLPSSLHYLQNYLNVREQRYKVKKNFPFIFITESMNGNVTQMSNRKLIDIVKKYTKAFGKEITPHKARYTFAKIYQQNGGTLIGLRDQLGHQNIETTGLYATESLKEQAQVLKRIDGEKNNEM